MRRIRVPEQSRVVVELRHAPHALYFPGADWQRIVLAPRGDRRMEEDAALLVVNRQCTGFLRNLDCRRRPATGDWRGRIRNGDVRHDDVFPGTRERRGGIQLAEQRRAGVELLAERFEWRRVAERGQP